MGGIACSIQLRRNDALGVAIGQRFEHKCTPLLPNTEAARSLSAIHVLPDQVVELADTPIAIVNDAIRDGQARPYVRDLAGWVVTLLRAQRDQGWKIIPPAPRADSPEALREVFARYAEAVAALLTT